MVGENCVSSAYRTFQQRLDRLQAEQEKAGRIECPACHHRVDDCEYLAYHITYHGEDGAKEDICPNCEAVLQIEECVTRTYEVTLSVFCT